MFGNKRKTASDAFVMAQGRRAGNLKEVAKKPPTKQPMKNNTTAKGAKAPVQFKVSPRQKIGAVGMLKKELR